MRFPGFVGPSYRARSINFDGERSINVYLETAAAGRPASEAFFLNRPGLTPYIQLSAGNIRALFAQDGRAFAVGGSIFAELFANQTAIIRGTVQVDSHPAYICSNGTGGNKLMVISGGLGYVFDLSTNTFSQITDDAFPNPCVMGTFFGSSGIALASNGEVFLSEPEDFTVWNGLDVVQQSESSDKTLAIARTHDTLWLFGSLTTAPWYQNGSSSILAPVQGSLIEHGLIAPYSIAALDNTLFCLGGDPLGAGSVYRYDGYTPKHISTPALETYLQQVKEAGGRIDDAVGYAMQFDSHLFYVLYVPSAPTTPVYDVSTDSWFEWTRWNPQTTRHEPFRGRCHAYAFGKHLIGDRASGTIYEGRLTAFGDQVVAA